MFALSVLWSLVCWAAAALYALGYLFAFRRIAGQWAWYFAEHGFYGGRDRPPTGSHWAGAICAASVLSLVWPLSLPIAYGIAGSRSATGLFYVPPKQRERIQAERIRELERLAGIK